MKANIQTFYCTVKIGKHFGVFEMHKKYNLILEKKLILPKSTYKKSA